MLAAMVEQTVAVKPAVIVQVVKAAAIKARRHLQILEVKRRIIIDMQKCGALFAPFFT